EALVVVKHEDGRAAWRAVPLRERPRDERPRVTVHWERLLVRPGEPARAALVCVRAHEGELAPVREGESVAAVLVDEQGRELARRDLATDRHGVARFEAPAAKGAQRLQVRLGGELARVDGPALLAGEPRAASAELLLHAPRFAAPG